MRLLSNTSTINRQTGSTLLSVMIMLPFLILIIAIYVELSVASLNHARGDQSRSEAQFATDAGTDYAVQSINDDPDWAGTTAVELHNDGSSRTTFEVDVEDVDSDTKTITSIGKTYTPVDAVEAKSSVTIKTDLRRVSSGEFSIVTGVGGLAMSNSSKILGGDVYVNGEITMSNSAQIGQSTQSVNLDVAHQSCPKPATSSYPIICGSGNGQPITISNTAHIYGDIQANNQTTTTGMSSPGLTSSSGVAALPLPTHDRDGQKAAVATTITGASASCWGSQTKTWAANTKITGDVTISNNCQVTVMGDVWITGNLYASNSTRLIVSDTLGGTRPSVMVDGSAGVVLSNSTILVSNASSTGFEIVTYYSRASCSPDCASVTGTDLYNSRNDTTISLSNSAEGPNTLFYARWTRVQVNNSGQIGAIVGQTIQLSNSATITFGTSTGGGTSSWIVDKYRRTFD